MKMYRQINLKKSWIYSETLRHKGCLLRFPRRGIIVALLKEVNLFKETHQKWNFKKSCKAVIWSNSNLRGSTIGSTMELEKELGTIKLNSRRKERKMVKFAQLCFQIKTNLELLFLIPKILAHWVRLGRIIFLQRKSLKRNT